MDASFPSGGVSVARKTLFKKTVIFWDRADQIIPIFVLVLEMALLFRLSV